MVRYTCHPSYAGSIDRRIAVQASTSGPIFKALSLKKKKKEKRKKDWECGGLSNRAPA
jgi:hypothetical protein